jgi:hypothetical protein
MQPRRSEGEETPLARDQQENSRCATVHDEDDVDLPNDVQAALVESRKEMRAPVLLAQDPTQAARIRQS